MALLVILAQLVIRGNSLIVRSGDESDALTVEGSEWKEPAWKEPFKHLEAEIGRLTRKDSLDERCYPIMQIPDEPPECVVVLMHGFTACPFSMEPIAKLFTDDRKCLVIIPTLPGHGAKEGGGTQNLPGGKQWAERYL